MTTTITEPNPSQRGHDLLSTAQLFLQHVWKSEVAAAAELMDDAVSYRVVGHNSLSGTFHGDQVTGHLCELTTTARRPFRILKWDDWMVGQSHVGAFVTIAATADTRHYRGMQLIVVGFASGGAINSVTVFFEDEAKANRFVDDFR